MALRRGLIIAGLCGIALAGVWFVWKSGDDLRQDAPRSPPPAVDREPASPESDLEAKADSLVEKWYSARPTPIDSDDLQQEVASMEFGECLPLVPGAVAVAK